MNGSALSKASVPNHACAPKLYGRRLLPQVLDEHSESSPQRLYASIPQAADLSQGFRNITCREMAGAVNGFAHWIKHKVGCSDSFETLAYIGVPDLRTATVFLAAVKTGHKVSRVHRRSWPFPLFDCNIQGSSSVSSQPFGSDPFPAGANKMCKIITYLRDGTPRQESRYGKARSSEHRSSILRPDAFTQSKVVSVSIHV